jgi:hypothetical protein
MHQPPHLDHCHRRCKAGSIALERQFIGAPFAGAGDDLEDAGRRQLQRPLFLEPFQQPGDEQRR